MVCEDDDGFNTLTQVRLFNDENEKDSLIYEAMIAKPLENIKIMNGSIPFYADVNKDGYTDILYNDFQSKKLFVALFNELTDEFDTKVSFWDTFISKHQNC